MIEGSFYFHDSYVHDQSYLINGYLSNIMINQTNIQDTQSIEILVSVIGSELTLNDSLIRNMSGLYEGVLIKAAFDSSLIIQNLTFIDSSIQLVRIVSSI